MDIFRSPSEIYLSEIIMDSERDEERGAICILQNKAFSGALNDFEAANTHFMWFYNMRHREMFRLWMKFICTHISHENITRILSVNHISVDDFISQFPNCNELLLNSAESG